MRNVATAFFLSAAVFALLGMAWGIQMSASHDYLLSPAHGHLNLLGFVVMAVFGTYYALTPQAAASRLAQWHFALALATVVVMTPGIVLAITDRGATLAQIGSLLAVATMALFAFMVLRHGVGSGRAVTGAAGLPHTQPAE